jgi:hypothetical protein
MLFAVISVSYFYIITFIIAIIIIIIVKYKNRKVCDYNFILLYL